jgi:hypothetical protein
MRVSLNTSELEKKINNIVLYSEGFIDGIYRGMPEFKDELGRVLVDALSRYVDVSAILDPERLHHVYEWYQYGVDSARLFEITYNVTTNGITLGSNFRQSSSMATGSTKPFYNKAMVMESGTPVTITPKSGGVLRFSEGGNEVFTRKPVTVNNPGGTDVQFGFTRTVDEFVTRYLKQSFLHASGLYNYISRPKLYKDNFNLGAEGGRSVGVATGRKWIANAKIRMD